MREAATISRDQPTSDAVTPRRKKVALQPRNESSALRYQPGMSLEDIPTMGAGSSSESEGLFSEEEVGAHDPLGRRLDESLDGQFEQHMMPPFSTPLSSISRGHTSTPPSNGHQNIV